MFIAIRESWMPGRNNKSESQIYDEIRKKLIFYDYQFRNMAHIDECGCTFGDDIDFYHLLTFDQVGLNNKFYGGNWMPQDTGPNPVPVDPR